MVPRRRGPRLPPDGYPQTGISGCIYQPAGRARQAPHPTRRLTGAAMLTVRDLRVTYAGAILGLRRVSLDVAAGSVVAVLGSNGAGKTTLLRAISGVLGEYSGAVEHGSIELDGQPLVGRSPAAIVGMGVVQAPECRDRKSTRLNSSHVRISYAVFCLKKQH